jgi:hypothetical protein
VAKRELVVHILGDDKSLRRAFTSSSRGASKFDKDMGKVTRGVLAGSGAFQGLARSVAFASSAFLGGVGLAAAIRGAFSELNESNKVTAQTNAVLRSTGQIAGVTAQHVEALGNELLRKTGIDDEAIRSSENLLLTFTNVRNVLGEGNNVFDQATRAILDMSAAMDGDLQGATIRVGKALQDPVRGVQALRRVGVLFTDSQEKQLKALVKTGRTMDAQKVILRELNREFGGSAEAAGNVQPWNRLRQTVANISAELARSLLPQITDTVERLQAWFDNTQNVERIQRDFATAVRITAEVLRTVRDAVVEVVDILGGLKNTLTVLVGAWAGFKAAAVASALAASAANVVAAGVTASAWRAALISTGWGAFAVAAGIAATYVIANWTKVKVFFQKTWIAIKVGALQAVAAILEAFSHVPGQIGRDASAARDAVLANIGGLREDFYNLGVDAGTNFWVGVFAAQDKAFRQGGKLGVGPGMTLRIPRDRATAPGFRATSSGGGLSAEQRNTFFDNDLARQLDRVQDASLREQLRKLAGIEKLIVARIAKTRDITRKLTLEDKLVQVRRQAKGVRAQLADMAAAHKEEMKQLRERQKELAEQARERAKLAEQTKQFRALGFGPGGAELIPGVKALRRQRTNIAEALKGTFLDTKKTRSILNQIRKVLSGGLGKVGAEVRAKIKEMLDGINQQLKDHARSTTKFRAIDTSKFLEGITGLTADQKRAIRARLAQVGAGGKVPTTGPSAFGIGLAGGGMVNNYNGPITVVADNPDAFERELVKKSRRRATQTTGPFAGNGMGFTG